MFRNSVLASAAAAVLIAGVFLEIRQFASRARYQHAVAKETGPPAIGTVVRPSQAVRSTGSADKALELAREAAAAGEVPAASNPNLAGAKPSGSEPEVVVANKATVDIVTIPPGASVRINGRLACKSNCRPSLSPGNYQIAAYLDGYMPVAVRVALKDGQTSVTLRLEPQTRSQGVLRDNNGVPLSGQKSQTAEATPHENTPGGLPANTPLGFFALILRGKVVMQDGSPPPKSVGLERVCSDRAGSAPGPITNKNGEFLWRMQPGPANRRCVLRAFLRGYTSTEIDISNLSDFDQVDLKLVLTAR